MRKPVLVAELGANHQGNIDLAYDMIEAAAKAGADYCKFQKRMPSECLTKERYEAPYLSEHSFGRTYGEHREKLEFSRSQHEDLKNCCEVNGIKYACSVWDVTSAKDIISLGPDYIKVPSAHNEDFRLLGYLFENWEKPIHISNGMMDPHVEELWREGFCQPTTKASAIVPYVCTSKYPCDMKDLKLGDIPNWTLDYEEVGFSGHHRGIAVDIAAYTLGATYIERHFTLDRTMKGRDHAASLEPRGLETLARDLKAVYSAMGSRISVLPCEEGEIERKVKSAWLK